MKINEPVNTNKNLNIVVVVDDSDSGVIALRHALELSKVFDASLSVFVNFGFDLSKNRISHRPSFIDKYLSHYPELKKVEVLDDYFFPETLYNYAETTNSAMIVVPVLKSDKKSLFSLKNVLKLIKNSRFPVMTVSNFPERENIYENILVTLDIERQNKEKALWAAYFCRFHGSLIHVLCPEYKDSGLSKMVRDNLDFVEKLYENLDVRYEVHKMPSSSYFDASALEFASQVNAGAMVVMTTKYYTLADLITGPRERKIIGNQELPILCINQRDDLYVLCT